MKDFFVFKHGEIFHMFYNVGASGPKQHWGDPGNEESFGHATSRDLRQWEHHPRILQCTPGTWSGKVVSAPSILPVGNRFAMIYTGFDDRVHGLQSVGLAWSDDLWTWEPHPGNPVYTGPAWTAWTPTQWSDCRDAHVIRAGDNFYMYTMVREAVTKLGAVSVARSRDLIAWEDLGAAAKVKGSPESPTVFEWDGKYFMVTGADAPGLFMSDHPGATGWKPVPFNYPSAGGLWTGVEVFRDGDRFVVAAFYWKLGGNHIEFWQIDWNDGLPVVRY